MNHHPTDQQSQPSQSLREAILSAKRWRLALWVLLAMAGVLSWRLLRPLPFVLVSSSHPSETTLLLSTNPTLTFTFSHHLADSTAIVVEPAWWATIIQQGTRVTMTPTDQALEYWLLTITFPRTLTDTQGRPLSQDLVFSYTVTDSLEISQISQDPLTVWQWWIVTFSHPVPDDTCPISFDPAIQWVCSKISPFSYQFKPLWLGQETYRYRIGFGDTQASGIVAATLPTKPTLTIADHHITLSLPTPVDSTTVQNNLRVSSGTQQLDYILTTDDNLTFRITPTDARPGSLVSITLNDLPLGSETMEGITQTLPNPSRILSVAQDKSWRGWQQDLCAVVRLNHQDTSGTQWDSYQDWWSRDADCLSDIIIDRPLFLTINPTDITAVILLADAKQIWETTTIQWWLTIPLETAQLINASSITIRLMAAWVVVQDLVMPLTPQKARIDSLAVVDGTLCLYASHRLRSSYQDWSFSLLFSHQSHNVMSNERYDEWCPEKSWHIGYRLHHRLWPNKPYTARISWSMTTQLGYPVSIPSQTFSFVSPWLSDSDKIINWNHRDTNTFPSHHDLRVRRTATNLNASYVHRCIKDYDPKRQRQRNWSYQFGSPQGTPCPWIQTRRIPSSGAQDPNRHKPIAHQFTIPTDEWKNRPNPEIRVTVSRTEKFSEIDQRYRFVPTSLSAFADATEKETLWFVTDWQGNPARNLRILDTQTNQELSLTQKKPGIRWSPAQENLWNSHYIITADQGTTVINGNTNMMDTWELNLDQNPDTSYEDTFVYIYTDRPLYKPTDEIFVKGIVRAYGEKGYTPLAQGTRGLLQLSTDDNEPLREWAVILDAVSSFSFRIPITNAPHGTYRWTLSLTNRDWWRMRVWPHTVLITDYVKPTFLVETQVPSSRVWHQAITLQGNARFYNGLNLPNVPVSINLLRQEIDFLPKGYDEFSFGDSSRYRYCRAWQWCANDPDFIPWFEIITTTTNANGTFSQTLDLSKTNPSTGKIYLYGITTSVTDPLNGETVVGNSEIIIYPSTTFFGIKAPRWVEGDTVSFSALALDQNAKPKANAPITATLARTRWEYGQKQSLDGNRYYSWDIKTENVATIKLTTNAQGLATHTMKLPTNGDERTIYLSDPTNPQTPVTTHQFWRWTNSYQTFSNTSVIELITDKKSYNVGETAKVSLRSPINTWAVLVMIQRDSTTLDQWVEPITQFGHQIKVPIKNTYWPNVYVKIALIGTDPELDYPIWRRGASNLKIDSSDKRLTVTVSTDKPTYKPKDTVTSTVTVTTPDGKPVVNADVSIAIVDMSLLALKGNPKKNPYAFFWDIARPLNTTSLWSVTNLLDANILLNQGDGEKGWDGILGEVDPTRVRGDFRDTARRQANAKTNAQGKLTITTPPLPDNLTQWQIEAVVNTKNTELGAWYHVFASKQDIGLIDNLPNVFISNDTITIQPTITNMTDVPKTLTLELSGYNISGLNTLVQTIKIQPQSRANVSFPIHITKLMTHEQTRSRVQLLLKEWSSVIDAVQRDIPLLPHHAVLTKNYNGNTQTLTLTTPSNQWFSEITVSTNPLGSMMHLIRANEVNIYGCLEQKSSWVFPHIVRHRIKKARGQWSYFSFSSWTVWDRITLSYDQTMKIQAFLNEIPQYQQDDGWMVYRLGYEQASDLRLSALVRTLLNQATDAWFDTSKIDSKKLKTYLIAAWKETNTDSSRWQSRSSWSPRFDPRVISAMMEIDPALVAKNIPTTISDPNDLMRRLATKPTNASLVTKMITQWLKHQTYQYKGIWAAQILGYLARDEKLWQETTTIHDQLLQIILTDAKEESKRSTWMVSELLLHLEPYITKLARDQGQEVSFSLNGKIYPLGTGIWGRETTITIPWTKTGETLTFDFGTKKNLYHLIQMTQFVEPLSLKKTVRGYAIDQTYYDYADIMAWYRKTPTEELSIEHLKQAIKPLTGTIVQGTRVAILTHISNPETDRRHVALDSFIPWWFVLSNPAFATSETIPDEVCYYLLGERDWWMSNPCSPRNIAEYHDTKFFAYQANLPAGEYFFLTLATARHPGTFVVKPATVFSFYEPQQKWSTQGQTITIVEKK